MSWGTVTDTLSGSKSGQRIVLSSSFIVEGSEVVTVDGRTLTAGQYEINYPRGVLRLKAPVGDESVVVVSYTRLPFLLNSVYSLRDIEFASPQQTIPRRKRAATQSRQLFNPVGDLVFGGVKSVSFAVGTNKSVALDQTLRATIEGNLTSSIKVKALLSDNNLPIQPEGNTQELEYLDKVFVELSGTRAKATLGDFAFANDISSFSAFRRELKGVSGEVTVGPSSVGAAAGSAKGTFRTLTFRGTEQLQGPYDLLSQGRVTGEVIIAGTEKVYLDGDLLQRGQNRDYTIDYDNGTLTFTPRRLMTVDSEIAVDFEATQEQYERTSIFGRVASGKLPGGFEFRALVARERDDPERPKSLSLEDDDRRALESAGDDPGSAIASGVSPVVSGDGDYELVPADTLNGTPQFYVFVDSTGGFDLQFVDVGGGNGDYVLDGITPKGNPFYRFAGAAQGNYVIGRKLPLPQSHRMITTRISRTIPGRLSLDVQYNVSDFDANTLSARDDGDNVGDAGEATLGIGEIPAGIGTLQFVGSISTVEERFRSLEKTRAWYFYRDWNLEKDALKGREILSNLTSTFERKQALRLDYELGNIRRDNFDGTKHEGRLALKQTDDRRFNARVFSTDIGGDNEDRTRRHATVSGEYGLWHIVPGAVFGTEEFSIESPVGPDSGIAYNRYVARIGKRKVDRIGYTFEAEQRDTEERADTTNGWIDTRRDRTFSASLLARGMGWVQGEAQYSHRIEDDRIIGDSRTSDLARLKTVLRSERIGFRANIDYEISQNQFRTQKKTVVFVGEGQGDFNELGEPVGKGRGDFTLVFLSTQDTVPTRSVNLTVHTSWKSSTRAGNRGGSWLDWVRANVALDQQLTVREQSTFKDATKLYLLFPSALQRNASTLEGTTSLRQDWSFLGGYPNLSVTFRYQRDDVEDNRFNNVREEQFFQQQIVRVDRSLSRLVTVNVEGTRELRRRSGVGFVSGTGSTFDVTGLAIAGGWGLRFSSGSTIDGQVELRGREDKESGGQEDALALRPRFVWRLSRALNVFGRYEITRFSGADGAGARPFFFSNNGTSQRWSLTPNLKLSRIISLVATYEGRSESTFSGKKVTEHDFRIETRAFF